MAKVTIGIFGMSCAACSAAAERALNEIEGVTATVNLMTETAVCEYDEAKVTYSMLANAITEAGFIPADDKSRLEYKEKQQKEERTLHLKRLIIACAFGLVLMYVAMAPMMGLPCFVSPESPIFYSLIQLVLCLPIIYVGRGYYARGFKTLIKLRPNMDSLVAVGTASATLFSLYATTRIIFGGGEYAHHLYYDTTGMIISFVMLGKYLEMRSKGKTGEAIKKLYDLSPKTATVIKNGEEVTIPVCDILEGDVVVIRPGESLSCDGLVLSGAAGVDESMLTGESLPVDKAEGSVVFAGTVNINGYLTVRATKVGADTSLSKIIRMVEDTSGSKAPIARLADKVAGVFVSVVMALAVMVFLAWLIFGKDFETALKIFVSVMVIACPCALGLATPTAIIVAAGRGAQDGLLFKNAEALEICNRISTVVLDKTGTVTVGKPYVTDIIPIDCEEIDLIAIAAALEAKSGHPIARAVTEYADKKEVTPPECINFEDLAGLGLRGEIDGNTVMIISSEKIKDKLTEEQIIDCNRLYDEGKTLSVVTKNDTPIGIFAFADKLKPTSKEAVKKLNGMGVRTILLTGDNERAAKKVATELEVFDYVAGVSPDKKAEMIEKLKYGGRVVAMVGDGINDAVALTAADVGIAIGAGSDIAIESAEVVLVRNDLRDVSRAIALSHATMKIIKMNLFWAFAYNTVMIPFAAGLLYAFGGPLLNPMIAAACMSLSSVTVVTNALRLKRIKYY